MLEKDNKRYSLLPLKVMPCPKDSKLEGQSFLTIVNLEREMEEVMKETKEVHALVVKNVLKIEEKVW